MTMTPTNAAPEGEPFPQSGRIADTVHWMRSRGLDDQQIAAVLADSAREGVAEAVPVLVRAAHALVVGRAFTDPASRAHLDEAAQLEVRVRFGPAGPGVRLVTLDGSGADVVELVTSYQQPDDDAEPAASSPVSD